MDILLAHASLFPDQVRQFFQTFCHKVFTLLIAAVLPLLLWLGLAAQPGRTKATPAIHTQEPLRNLIYVNLPAVGYEEVAQRRASNRRGLWQEIRPDGHREEELWITTTESNNLSVRSVLPNFDLSNLRTDLTYSFQTVLPHCLANPN
jgi:hypothetical protein